MGDFALALAAIPNHVPRVHHGRDEEGLDCLGLIVFVYAKARLSIDDIDLPYAESDAANKLRCLKIRRQLRIRFKEFPVLGHKFKDGDVLLIDNSHLGLYAYGLVFQMGDGLRRTNLRHVVPWTTGVYRHESLCG